MSNIQIYIDESGNLGTGGGRFFVITALIPQNPKRIKNIIKRVFVRFYSGQTAINEIKGFYLKWEQKQEILNLLKSKDDFTCSYIVADKKHLTPEILNDKNICYNYLANFLFKPLVKGATGDIQVILDNHTVKVASINSLQDYIKIEAYTKWGFKGKMTFEHKNSKDYKNLQAVDVLSNIIWQRYSYDKEHLYNLIEKHFLHRIQFPIGKFKS